MAIQERLLKFIGLLDKSILSFENECGLAPGTVSKMTENSRPRTFDRISKAFPELNIDWLKTGEGEMLRAGYTQHVHGGERVTQTGDIVTGDTAVVIRALEIVEEAQRQNRQLQDEIVDINRRLLEFLKRSGN